MATIVSREMRSPYETDFQERLDPVTQWLDAGCPSDKRRPAGRHASRLAVICIVATAFAAVNLYKEYIAPVAAHHTADDWRAKKISTAEDHTAAILS